MGKNGRKMEFGSAQKKREKWPKNWEERPKNVSKMGFSGHFPISRPFFPQFPGVRSPRSNFWPFFAISGQRPEMGLYRPYGITSTEELF